MIGVISKGLFLYCFNNCFLVCNEIVWGFLYICLFIQWCIGMLYFDFFFIQEEIEVFYKEYKVKVFGDVFRFVFDMEYVNFLGILGKYIYIYICCFILNKVIRNKFEKICQFFFFVV